MIGRRAYGGTSTYIPLKVNQAGIIPVIFASSLLYLPQLLSKRVDQQRDVHPIITPTW
jgi:preprotein translocase subunit SecY